MSEKIKSLLVLGLGKVGSMVAALLQETGFEVIGADMNDTDGMPFPVKKFSNVQKLWHEPNSAPGRVLLRF